MFQILHSTWPWRRSGQDTTVSASPDGTYDPKATQEDILYCFRLLLGRDPNPEEMRGHMMRVGEDLAGVVASYLGSLEFANRGLLQTRHEDDLTISEVEGFRIYASAADAAVGKHVCAGNYEPEVTTVVRRFVREGMHAVDIGANIGYFAMLCARLVGGAGKVTAIEPNPRNVRLLEASRRANGFEHVTIVQMAAGRDIGLLSLNTSHSNGTTSALRTGIDAVLAADMVPCMPLDTILATAKPIDFIKVDVEGAEYNALFGCVETIRRCRPVIVSEFSPNLMPGISGIGGADYLHWLAGLGYGISVIELDGSLAAAGKDAARVLQHYSARGTDHIDIAAIPD
jgi:FkbM family methyltransferase